MGRKRYVTTDMSTDAKVVAVAQEWSLAGLMWPWFIQNLDDWARMTGNPLEIKFMIFQAFECSCEDIEHAIDIYVKRTLIHRYAYGDKVYLQANPKAFYELQTYIQKSRQKHDGSKLPPPRDHPWGAYWPTSDWDDNGQRHSATNDEQ